MPTLRIHKRLWVRLSKGSQKRRTIKIARRAALRATMPNSTGVPSARA